MSAAAQHVGAVGKEELEAGHRIRQLHPAATMDGPQSDTLRTSLLQWVRSFEELGKVDGWADLSDGSRLWSILREVDEGYFSGSIPEPDVGSFGDWTRKWQNLKHLERQISTYYRDFCNDQDGIGAGYAPDLKAIAAEASVRDLEKLVMIIIRAAMASGESNQKMAQRLMSLGRENAMVIANELRNMEEPADTEADPVSRDESAYQSEQETVEEPKTNGKPSNAAPYTDPLLEREEELLQAQAIVDKLQASQATAQRQLQELRQDKERLQEAFDAYRAEIDAKGRNTGGEDALKKLQRQAENDRAYIEELEGQLHSSRGTIESYEKQIELHKADSEANQTLRDDLQMLRGDNEDLNQKVKANENLKKKIQTLQEQEKINVTLREDLKSANERLEELDRLKQVQAGLEKEVIEKKGLIRNQEYQINELTTTRKHAEYDARVLAQKLEAARERHDRDHEALEDLRLKLQDTQIDEPEDDEPEIAETPQEQNKQLSDGEQQRKVSSMKDEENKHLAEKLALLEQQLEAADARLKQAAERNDTLEGQARSQEADAAARQEAERHVAEQEGTIAELRQHIDAASKQPQRETPARDLATLQRENHLMATAWYDLSSRMQNNGVSLGRRRQEPKSWIGKQRALVGPSSSVQR
ncbi:hypothetical protein LTR65_000453 [Meristemomyces frigidus]